MTLRLIGLLIFAIGAALASGPWWSTTLPRSDYPLVWVLGALFGGIGLFVALPDDRLPRLRSFVFCVFLAAFGIVCAALALAPTHLAPDGSYAIAGIPGISAASIPWWARIVAAFFALALLVPGVLGLWGLFRDVLGRDR